MLMEALSKPALATTIICLYQNPIAVGALSIDWFNLCLNRVELHPELCHPVSRLVEGNDRLRRCRSPSERVLPFLSIGL